MSLTLLLATAGAAVSAAGTIAAFASARWRGRTKAAFPDSRVSFCSRSLTRHSLSRWLQAATTVLAVALTVSAGSFIQHGLSYCGPGIQRLSGQCAGVTDGSYVFNASMATVERQIYAENVLVDRQHRPFVTIAYLAPMTQTPGEAGQVGSVLRELEGAYVAQSDVNQSGREPLVKLVLASDGSTQQSWVEIVRRLGEMTGAAAHLVAVVGVGDDGIRDRLTALALSRLGIPMISTASATSAFSNQAVPGFFSVAPDITSQEADLAEYAAEAGTRSAVLVASDSAADTYSRDFASGIREYYPVAGGRLSAVLSYDPDAASPEVLSRAAAKMICAAKNPTVFFAGRAEDLGRLLDSLTRPACRHHQITVLTGSDAALLAQSTGLTRAWAAAGITVDYTAAASPTQWAAEFPASQDRAASAFRAFANRFGALYGLAALADGQAMLAHDAVLTAASAAQMGEARTPTASAVLNELPRLHGPMAVAGATGIISFDTQSGNPDGKPVPILRLTANRQVMQLTVLP